MFYNAFGPLEYWLEWFFGCVSGVPFFTNNWKIYYMAFVFRNVGHKIIIRILRFGSLKPVAVSLKEKVRLNPGGSFYGSVGINFAYECDSNKSPNLNYCFIYFSRWKYFSLPQKEHILFMHSVLKVMLSRKFQIFYISSLY